MKDAKILLIFFFIQFYNIKNVVPECGVITDSSVDSGLVAYGISVHKGEIPW